jgi:hypothetical protein
MGWSPIKSFPPHTLALASKGLSRSSIRITCGDDHLPPRAVGMPCSFKPAACGKHGADVRPDFNWNRRPVAVVGYR